jgi:DHA1 family tetracycline resistance protein-like MFS transporter
MASHPSPTLVSPRLSLSRWWRPQVPDPTTARRVMVVLAVCLGLQMTGFVMILPLFARRMNDFGVGVEALAASATAYALTGTLASPFAGALADRFGRRPLVLVSLAAYALSFCGYLVASSAWAIIALRGIAGALTAGLIPAVMGIVSDLAPANRRAQWVGIVNGGAAVGWILGPPLGGLLYDQYGYVVAFAVSIAIAVGTFLISVFLVPETHAPAPRLPAEARQPGGGGRKAPRWPAAASAFAVPAPVFALLLAISFVVMFTWALVEPQFMFYAYEDLAWTSSQLGLVMSVYGVAMVLGELTTSRLSDRWGRRPVLVLGLGLYMSQFLGLVLFRDFAPVGLAFAIAGFGNALYDPALNAYLMDIAPPDRKASTMGVKSTVMSFGAVLGPALVVVLARTLRPQSIFAISTALVIVTALVTLLWRERSVIPHPVEPVTAASGSARMDP